MKKALSFGLFFIGFLTFFSSAFGLITQALCVDLLQDDHTYPLICRSIVYLSIPSSLFCSLLVMKHLRKHSPC